MNIATVLIATSLTGLFGLEGSGRIVEQKRQVAAFESVDIGLGIEATVSVGPQTSVTIEGDDNILAVLRTEVVNGRLETRLEGTSSIRPTRKIRLTITTPKLSSIDASGGARVTAQVTPTSTFSADASGGSKLEIRGLATGEAKTSASGGSEIHLHGSAQRIETELSGGAELQARDVCAGTVVVEGSGGSEANVCAKNSISAELSGGSRLSVAGKPDVRQVEVSGGSRVVYE